MTTVCEPSLLSAYLDGEAGADQRRRVEAHLAECPACAAELAQLRELSRSISAYQLSDDLAPAELARVHDALDDAAEGPVWRIGGVAGLIAASVLVISGTWLLTLPAGPARPGGGAGATVAAGQRPTSSPQSWEQIATRLRVHSPAEVGDAVYAQAMLDALNRENVER